MLFDHGADAVSTFLITIQVMEILQIRSGTDKIGVIYGMVMISYFCAMWSQYSTGVFKLGVINPIDDGLPGYALFAIMGIFIPHTLWNSPSVWKTLS